MSTSSFTEALVKSIKQIPYNSDVINNIKNNRKKLGGSLFFDDLIHDIADIESTNFYPPKDIQNLLLLIQKIESKISSNRVNQSSLIYYLFLDYPISLTSNESLSNYYADEVGIPIGYRELITGFWYMDQLNFNEALIHLGHPEALPTYQEKIVESFAKSSSLSSSCSQIIAYLNCKTPKLTSPESVEYYLDSLSEISIFKALQFIRTVSPDIQSNLFQRVIENSLLNPNPKSRKKNLWRLANLSLTENESSVLKETLFEIIQSSTDPTITSLSKDILLLRSLHTNDKDTIKQLSHLPNPSSTPSQVEWSDIIRGISLST